ncbi:hypothetical protein PVAND_010457 [Polypedilum vanderplanki]|uniref:Acetyl-coenzyme A transporter 1 n=1 Tax=Polypedilum vanderplanki TaxID=319348 RepID=A0A9J6CGH6_POLVA|nr:hypothetical protein PVAND_010457 [Polypedilum vanderplanki]
MNRNSSENFEIEQNSSNEEEKPNLKGDFKNVVLLVVLYIFQSIPLGLVTSVPILMQNRGATYKDQAIFTIAYYPFSLKILWAPIVDSLYFKRIGRRKTWLVPSQFMIALSMLYSSFYVNEWLGSAEKPPKILILTSVFFLMRVFAATQDVAVDGLALCLLKKRNIGHVATCEMIGISCGWCIGYVVLLVLESSEFSNSFIFSEPRNEGLITLGGFLKFWGIAFLVFTILIAFFKHENSETDEKLEEHPDYGVTKAYPTLWKILKLKPIIRFSLFMLTVKVSFSAVDSVTSLKLIEYGVPKDKIAFLAIPVLPIQIILPFIISRFTAGKYPMDFYIKAFRVRLAMSILMVAYVFLTSKIVNGKKSNEISIWYFIGLVIVYLMYHIPFRAMTIADMSFFARVSDPLIGGTYMTLLNTINNFGTKWSQTLFLWLVDIISWKHCIQDNHFNNSLIISLSNNKCANKEERDLCIKAGGKCLTDIDGYYIEFIINLIYGIGFYVIGKRIIEYLEKLPIDDWHVLAKEHERVKENENSSQREEKIALNKDEI